MKIYSIFDYNELKDLRDIDLPINELEKKYENLYDDVIIAQAEGINELATEIIVLLKDYYENDNCPYGDPVDDLFRYVPKNEITYRKLLEEYNYGLKAIIVRNPK